LKENIIKSGKLLQHYIEAQASYEGSLRQQSVSIVTDDEKELDQLNKQAVDCSSKLREQQKDVQQKVENYEEAVVEWQNKETIKAALDLASV
jgi:hypothetical protein